MAKDLQCSKEGPPPSHFKTGAKPTPMHRIMQAQKYCAAEEAPPDTVSYVPPKLSMWGNDQMGDCVTAEEAYTKAAHEPTIMLADDVVIRWARDHGWDNGAYLEEVLQAMQDDGFRVGAQQYNDGAYSVVDYSSEEDLKSAIAQGPVKIAIASASLPGDAGGKNGWWITKKSPSRATDHCVSLGGYGTAKQLYDALSLPLPSGLPADTPGYLLFTWSSLGFVSHQWLMGTCVEAWVRNPSTVGIPPLPDPNPPGPPDPPPPPNPTPGCSVVLDGYADLLLMKLPIHLEGQCCAAGQKPQRAESSGRASIPDWLKQLLEMLMQWLLSQLGDDRKGVSYREFQRRKGEGGGDEESRPGSGQDRSNDSGDHEPDGGGVDDAPGDHRPAVPPGPHGTGGGGDGGDAGVVRPSPRVRRERAK